MNKYKNLGFDYANIKRIINPLNAKFNFVEDKKSVKIERARDVLPFNAYNNLLRYHHNHPIQKRSCHQTACEVAYRLKDFGVEVCDGFYCEKSSGNIYAHTFCKLNDRYFDPTIEFAYSYLSTARFEYFSERIYKPKEFLLIQFAIGYLTSGDYLSRTSTSTICKGFDVISGNYYDVFIDKDGNMVDLLHQSRIRAA